MCEGLTPDEDSYKFLNTRASGFSYVKPEGVSNKPPVAGAIIPSTPEAVDSAVKNAGTQGGVLWAGIDYPMPPELTNLAPDDLYEHLAGAHTDCECKLPPLAVSYVRRSQEEKQEEGFAHWVETDLHLNKEEGLATVAIAWDFVPGWDFSAKRAGLWGALDALAANGIVAFTSPEASRLSRCVRCGIHLGWLVTDLGRDLYLPHRRKRKSGNFHDLEFLEFAVGKLADAEDENNTRITRTLEAMDREARDGYSNIQRSTFAHVTEASAKRSVRDKPKFLWKLKPSGKDAGRKVLEIIREMPATQESLEALARNYATSRGGPAYTRATFIRDLKSKLNIGYQAPNAVSPEGLEIWTVQEHMEVCKWVDDCEADRLSKRARARHHEDSLPKTYEREIGAANLAKILPGFGPHCGGVLPGGRACPYSTMATAAGPDGQGRLEYRCQNPDVRGGKGHEFRWPNQEVRWQMEQQESLGSCDVCKKPTLTWRVITNHLGRRAVVRTGCKSCGSKVNTSVDGFVPLEKKQPPAASKKVSGANSALPGFQDTA